MPSSRANAQPRFQATLRALLVGAVVLGGFAFQAPARADIDDADVVPEDQAIIAAPYVAPDAPTEHVQRDETRAHAFGTQVAPIGPTPNEKRQAAVQYLDSALALLDLARAHLRDADLDPQCKIAAHAELMAASGKATTACLLLFHDQAAAARVRELASQLGQAEAVSLDHPAMALALINRDQPALASVYETELATMGGGAGR